MLQRAFAPSGLCQKNFRAALQEPGELRDALREGRGSAARGRLGGPRAEQRGCDDVNSGFYEFLPKTDVVVESTVETFQQSKAFTGFGCFLSTQ